MATTAELMATGMPALQARMLGQDQQLAISAAGTTQTAATLLKGGLCVVTTVASLAGVRLPPASGSSETVVFNGGANTLTVYPATSEKINNGTANVGVQIAVGKAADFMPSANQWVAILGA